MMKILIADDHALFRDGLALRLEEIAPDAVITQASSYAQVFKILKAEPDTDVLILDIEMPDMPWLDSLRQIRQIAPKTKIIVISASEDSRTVRTVLATFTS